MTYPKALLSLRNLQGGQYGTIDVRALSDELVELDWGPDFVRLSPGAAEALILVLSRWLAQRGEVAHDVPAPPSREVIVIIDQR